MGVEGVETAADKRHLSHSMVNAMGGKYLRASRRPNKSRKYNGNTTKDRNNRAKRLALLGRYPNRQPKVRIWLAKTNTKVYYFVMPPTYQPRNNTFSSWYREL